MARIKPLIDADMLVYQVGFAQQKKNEQGELEINSFDSCAELLDTIVEQICQEVWATEPPTFYLTGSEFLIRSLNRTLKSLGQPTLNYERNYREQIAKTTPYKANRPAKPYHYQNLMVHIANNYDTKVAIGMEADDLIAMDHLNQNKDYKTVLCSRDKDLKMIPGKHYSWPCYKSDGCHYEVDELGVLEQPVKGKGIAGNGLKFFYAQCLVGDRTDTIPGLPDYGPVSAYKLLKDCGSEEECFSVVLREYEHNGKDRDYFKEQANLLWIARELKEGKPVLYVPVDERQ